MTSSTLFNNDYGQVTLCKLPLAHGFTENTSLEENADPFEGINISHRYCTAQLSLYGGQVLSFKPRDREEVFWLSRTSSYEAGKAIRGGIPLCWPWFGRNDKQAIEQKVVNHGFARLHHWQVERINADESGVVIILTLTGENQHCLWPNAYKLTQTLFFGKKFTQTLAMANLSTEDAQYSIALHSYFNVSNPSNISIDALTGLSYYDKLTEQTAKQRQSVNCVGEIDRVYPSASGNKITFIDKEWQRKITIVSKNCQQWVLWNPGSVLANTMADIHEGGEHEYVCLEAANTTWQDLPASKSVVISQEITVTDL
ncbi:MAG: D-hexose-6-phosphate mutarotase [Colwellia sp.]